MVIRKFFYCFIVDFNRDDCSCIQKKYCCVFEYKKHLCLAHPKMMCLHSVRLYSQLVLIWPLCGVPVLMACHLYILYPGSIDGILGEQTTPLLSITSFFSQKFSRLVLWVIRYSWMSIAFWFLIWFGWRCLTLLNEYEGISKPRIFYFYFFFNTAVWSAVFICKSQFGISTFGTLSPLLITLTLMCQLVGGFNSRWANSLA